MGRVFRNILYLFNLCKLFWCLHNCRVVSFSSSINIQLAFSIILRHWNDAGSWNSSSWVTRKVLYRVVNIKTALDILPKDAEAWRRGMSGHSIDLTHCGPNKLAAIFQTTFSNAFSWIKECMNFDSDFSIGPMNTMPALVQILSWWRSSVKPLSQPMMANLLTRICVTRPQWVNQPRSFWFQYETNSTEMICDTRLYVNCDSCH